MNEAFFALTEEKRQNIINAALEVFSRSDYKRASTDDIAAGAGISKGLLFYYFHNKKSLYLYLFDYIEQVMRENLSSSDLWGVTDFFDFLELGAERKAEIQRKNPAIMDFSVRAFYSKDEEVSGDMAERLIAKMNSAFGDYFKHIDFGKFREGVDAGYLFRMLSWMTDGYLHERQMAGQPLEVSGMMGDFHRWVELFRRMVYKEEYLHEDDRA